MEREVEVAELEEMGGIKKMGVGGKQEMLEEKVLMRKRRMEMGQGN